MNQLHELLLYWCQINFGLLYMGFFQENFGLLKIENKNKVYIKAHHQAKLKIK